MHIIYVIISEPILSLSVEPAYASLAEVFQDFPTNLAPRGGGGYPHHMNSESMAGLWSLFSFLSSPYQSSPLKGPVSRVT